MKKLLLIPFLLIGIVASNAQSTRSVSVNNFSQRIVAPTNFFEINLLIPEYFEFTRQSITSGVVTLRLSITNATTDASPDGASDYVLTYSAAAGDIRKVLLNNLPGSGSSSALELLDEPGNLDLLDP